MPYGRVKCALWEGDMCLMGSGVARGGGGGGTFVPGRRVEGGGAEMDER